MLVVSFKKSRKILLEQLRVNVWIFYHNSLDVNLSMRVIFLSDYDRTGEAKIISW